MVLVGFADSIFRRVVTGWWKKLRRSKARIGCKASVSYVPYYDMNAETFFAVPQQLLEERAVDVDVVGTIDTPLVAMRGSPFPIVVSAVNQTDDIPMSVTEVRLRIIKVASDVDSLFGKTGVFHHSVQAGGRGSEGSFDVTLAADVQKVQIHLFGQATAQSSGRPCSLAVEPGYFAEIFVRVWINSPGAYLVMTDLDVRTAWQEAQIAAGPFRLTLVSDETKWPDVAVEEFNGGDRRGLSASEFSRLLSIRAGSYGELASIPRGSKSLVAGECIG